MANFLMILTNVRYILLQGQGISVYEELAWIQSLKSTIQDLYARDKYFIGFCFGHQLIGAALGGNVAKSPSGWCVGVHSFEVAQSEAWMKPMNERIRLLMMCQDQIINLPNEAKVLASNTLCPNAIIKVGEHFLGIQAHPEFTKEYDKHLMNIRMNKMGDDVANEGIKSLSLDIDSALIKSWILNFVNAL